MSDYLRYQSEPGWETLWPEETPANSRQQDRVGSNDISNDICNCIFETILPEEALSSSRQIDRAQSYMAALTCDAVEIKPKL